MVKDHKGFAHTDYLSIYLLGTLFVELSVGLNTFINTQGRPTIAMYSVLIGAILNIGLDPLFIFTFGMGVKGAALATILSQACSAIWVISFLTSKKASLRLEYRYMKLHKGIILSILALGVSPFIMAITESLVGFVLNSSLEKFGDIYVSALAIMQSAMLIVSVPLTGFAQGFVPIVSYNYGHHNRERVKECFKIVVIIMFSFNFLLIAFMILFPSLVASAFTNDETLIETVRQVMPIFLGGMTIFGLDELEFLAHTAGAVTVKRFTQKVNGPNSVTYVGKGKLDEIRQYIETEEEAEREIGMVIFDDELSAKQIRNIEKELKVKILDRTSLILDIFAMRAQTANAKTQVDF